MRCATAGGGVPSAPCGLESDVSLLACQTTPRLATQARRYWRGDEHIGQVLARAPSCADDTWPHAAIRDFKVANEEGAQKRAIAARHRRYADELALTHPRTAGMLRRIADDCEGYAQHVDERADQLDLD